MITKEMAMELFIGQVLYHGVNRNADSSPQRWVVNGNCKTWKTRKHDFQVPLKFGLYTYDYLNQACADKLFLTKDEALGRTMQYRLLKSTWESNKDLIKKVMIAQAEVAIKNNWPLHSEVAYTFLFDDGAFDPFYLCKTPEAKAYESYCQENGNEDDETELLGELWITTLKKVDSKRYKDVIAKFQDIKDNGL